MSVLRGQTHQSIISPDVGQIAFNKYITEVSTPPKMSQKLIIVNLLSDLKADFTVEVHQLVQEGT